MVKPVLQDFLCIPYFLWVLKHGIQRTLTKHEYRGSLVEQVLPLFTTGHCTLAWKRIKSSVNIYIQGYNISSCTYKKEGSRHSCSCYCTTLPHLPLTNPESYEKCPFLGCCCPICIHTTLCTHVVWFVTCDNLTRVCDQASYGMCRSYQMNEIATSNINCI